MNELITIDETNRAIIANTTVTVEFVLEGVKAGSNVEQIAQQLQLTLPQVKAALDFATASLPQPYLAEIDYEMLLGAASYLDGAVYDLIHNSILA